MSLITGGLGYGAKLITSGFGYSIIIPVQPPPPKEKVSIRLPAYYDYTVPREFVLPLKALEILDEYNFVFKIKPLSTVKLLKLHSLLSDLEINLSKELRILIDGLFLIAEDASDMKISDLKIPKKSAIKLCSEDLNILSKGETVYGINCINLAAIIRKTVQLQIPNIYIGGLKRLKKYLELMELLNRLEEI